jgi:hypothetical protein
LGIGSVFVVNETRYPNSLHALCKAADVMPMMTPEGSEALFDDPSDPEPEPFRRVPSE